MFSSLRRPLWRRSVQNYLLKSHFFQIFTAHYATTLHSTTNDGVGHRVTKSEQLGRTRAESGKMNWFWKVFEASLEQNQNMFCEYQTTTTRSTNIA